MFKFGVHALSQFKSRYGEWPQYFTHILQIPHLKQAHPDLYDMIERALRLHPNPGLPGLEESLQATSISSPDTYGQSRLPQSRLPLQSPSPGPQERPPSQNPGQLQGRTSPNPHQGAITPVSRVASEGATPLTSLNINTVRANPFLPFFFTKNKTKTKQKQNKTKTKTKQKQKQNKKQK